MVLRFIHIYIKGLIYKRGNRGYEAAVQNGLSKHNMRDLQKLNKVYVINYLLCEIFKEHVI